MAQINNDNLQVIFYTEEAENKSSGIKAFPVKDATQTDNGITIELGLEGSAELNNFIDFLNNNKDFYSKVVIKVADYDPVVIKG